MVRIATLYSYDSKSVDIFSISGSVVAQHGASGGAVVGQSGKLIGLIVTSSSGDTTAERNLNALTISHVNKGFEKETGDPLQVLIKSDLAASAENFNTQVAPRLTKLLEDVLTGK